MRRVERSVKTLLFQIHNNSKIFVIMRESKQSTSSSKILIRIFSVFLTSLIFISLFYSYLYVIDVVLSEIEKLDSLIFPKLIINVTIYKVVA